MPRIHFGRSRSSWENRNDPFSPEVRITASSPMQKALFGVILMVAGIYLFATGEISVGEYGDFELTGAPVLLLGGGLAALGAYLAVMNAFSNE